MTTSFIVIYLLQIQSTLSVQITRKVSFINNLTQSDAICGETVKQLLSISINAEPGTERKIGIEFLSNQVWAQIQAPNTEFVNEILWSEYVKRQDLTVSIDLILKVPGCEPSTNVAISISGIYKGGICEEQDTECHLDLPQSSISFITEKPRIGTLIIPQFNVIRGKWTKPIKIMIPHKLLIPEQLIINPKSLLLDVLQFQSSLIESNKNQNPILFTYNHPYFPKITYMFIKAKEDLALSQTLEIEYNLKCPQCKFNQFPEKVDSEFPAVVSESSKQRFVPFYIPTMKIWHKYCFRLSLNKAPSIEINVVFEICDTMIIEPREIIFSKENDLNESMNQRFCITPTQETNQCILKFFLTGNGQSVDQYIKPDPINIYSKQDKLLYFNLPTIINTINRKISSPQILGFEQRKGEYLDIIITPKMKQSEFFKFEPESFRIQSENMHSNQIEFYVTPNVDCPISDDLDNISLYYIINWEINGSLGIYNYPNMIYIKVIENQDELTPFESWCNDKNIDCNDPPNGQTCFIDQCILNINNPNCQSLFIKIDKKKSRLFIWWQYIMITTVIIGLIIIFIKLCGCCHRKENDDQDNDFSIDNESRKEERKIFNTKENLVEAQIAIQHLLYKIYHHEKNMDINKKYQRDIHPRNYYDD